MGTYRLYCLDGVDSVACAEWIEADDDQAAIKAAESIRSRHAGAHGEPDAAADWRKCELWQNSRLVARLEARRES